MPARLGSLPSFASDVSGVLSTPVAASSVFVVTTTQTGSYTLKQSDHNTVVLLNFSAAGTLTLPSGLTAGTTVEIIQMGTGAVTLASGSGATLGGYAGGVTLAGLKASARARLLPSGEWNIAGGLAISTGTTGTPASGQIFSSGASVTMLAASSALIVRKGSSGSATAVTLPSSPVPFQLYSVKDGQGDAATNPITITPSSGSIEGQTSFVISYAYQTMTFLHDGSAWNVIS